MMADPMRRLRRLGFAAAWAALTLLPAGCLMPGQQRAAMPDGGAPMTAQENVRQQVRERRPINTRRNLYEGSLWRGSASWGNLMRDHRARFRGDLLTVRELNRIINVPDVVAEPEVPAAPQEEPPQQLVDPLIIFLEEQRMRREDIEREQADILRSLDQVEVQVVRVLPNGNLLVRGTHPPIFRDNNRVKYLFSVKGIVRPRDVDDDNSIVSTKLSKAEYKLTRLVKRESLPLGSLARAGGRKREGALLDRFTDFLTTPSQRTVGTGR